MVNEGGADRRTMSSYKSQQTYNMGGRKKADTQWSDIDKGRLYSIGTVMYSALTVALHPLTVTKIRRQVLKNNGQSTTSSTATTNGGAFFNNISQYYRGLGVVVSLAIPARIIYISTLEYSRELVDTNARDFISNPPAALSPYSISELEPMVTPFSGGVAGGVAAVSSQMIVVPMDVISQKLIVMEDSVYKRQGSTMKVVQSIIKAEGYRGLYKGFGLSLFTSLPAGSIWWATYAGTKDQLSMFADPDVTFQNEAIGSIPVMARQGIIQVAAAFSAAVSASVLTQPLDTLKTRIQVGKKMNLNTNASILSMAKELASTPGLYRGLMPRIYHMSIWGSILSAAFEVLKLVSRKDFEL